MATCKDVALRAGVSIASVSRAFHNNAKMAPETRERIMQAARDLGYYPNAIAKSLKDKRSRMIGVIVPDIDNPWYMPVIKYMERTLRQESYRLLIMFNDSEEGAEQETLIRMMSARVEGIMFTPLSRKSKDTIQLLQAQGICLLQLYTNEYEDISAMEIDNEYGVYIAIRHLLQKGYRKILNVGGNTHAYTRAHEEARVPVHPGLCIPFETKNMQAEITRRITEMKPDAVLAIANRLGTYTLSAFETLGLSFPDDIGFLMYDDVSWVSLLNITAIAHPIETVADTAARCMLQVIHQKTHPGLVHSMIKPYLVERGSTTRQKSSPAP